MAGKELVGPLRRHGFGMWRRRIVLAADLPKDTRDIRFAACAAHRFACDCREATLAESIAEWRGEIDYVRRQLNTVLAGHITYALTWRGDVDNQRRCHCSGCQIARATSLRTETDQEAEDIPVEWVPPAGSLTEEGVRAWHQQGPRSDGAWGCACGWRQTKPHAQHVEDMAEQARWMSDDSPPF